MCTYLQPIGNCDLFLLNELTSMQVVKNKTKFKKIYISQFKYHKNYNLAVFWFINFHWRSMRLIV